MLSPPSERVLPQPKSTGEKVPPLPVWSLPHADDLGVTMAIVGRTGTGKTHTAKAFVRALADVWKGKVGVFVLMAGGQAAEDWRAFLDGSGEPDDVTMLPDYLAGFTWDAEARRYRDEWLSTVPAYGDARPRELVAFEAWLGMHLSARRVLVASYHNNAMEAPRAILVVDDVVNIIGTAFGQNLCHAPMLREALMRGRQYGMSTVVLSQQPHALAPMMRAINILVPVDGTAFEGVFARNLAERVPAPYELEAVLASTRVTTDEMRRGRFVPVIGEGFVACAYVRPGTQTLASVVAPEAVSTRPARRSDADRAEAARAALRPPGPRPRDSVDEPAVSAPAVAEAPTGGSLLSAAMFGARWRMNGNKR